MNDSTSNKLCSPRRSGRARVSTTIQINGHTVLRKNNYQVTAHQYVFNDKNEDVTSTTTKANVANKKPRRQQEEIKKKKPATKQQQKVATTSRVTSAAEHARQRHNQSVTANVQRKHNQRMMFLSQHLNTLMPFCEPHVLDMLQQQREVQDQKKPPAKKKAAVVTVQQPKMIIETATLRPYQLKGLEFMIRMHQQNLAMILGDEMGLGKTLQTIALLCHLKEQEEQITGPSLIICPLSVLSSWCNEMTKWAPSLKYFRLHASNAEEQDRQKQLLKDHATEYDVILTTYEMAKVPTLTRLYQRLSFHYLVLDEGHKIKGHETLLAQAVRKIHAGNKLILTGTPLQNNLVELWSLLNFLHPDIFTAGSLEPFNKHFNLSEHIVDKDFLLQTQHLLELFMLRRLKQEVETLLPPKLETKVYCPLSKTQTFWYRALLMKDVDRLARIDNDTDPTSAATSAPRGRGRPPSSNNKDGAALGTKRHALLKALFMQLRKCCNHPYLFDGAETNPHETTIEELISSSGKLSVLDMILQSLYRNGHRVVLFSQFTMMLDLLEDYCGLRGWKFCRLDGSTERARRNYLIRRWNEPQSEYFVFLMSTRSGGMGLNLQTADTCILFDSDWNPQSDIQAMGRVHRIGQTRAVHVYRLVSSGTIEERMLERAEKKLLLEMVNRESFSSSTSDAAAAAEEKARGLSAAELLEDIKFGSAAVFGNSNDNKLPTWTEIDAITDRKRKENDSVGKLVGGTSKSVKSFDATKEFSATQQFGGLDFREIRRKQEEKLKRQIPKHLGGIAHLWKEIQALDGKKRERKSRIVQVDGIGSGYGSAAVPVLASNNYDLQHGESSVFARELNQSHKVHCEVKKRKKGEIDFEHQDHCQVCGDGGFIVMCPRCPCAVHLECIGLTDARQFLCCTHHRCTSCGKNRLSAGGLLYPCACCPQSFCEDCLPETGVTFLEKVDRFETLGFDSTKNVVYIHCSSTCEDYAKQEFGYNPQKKKHTRACPTELDLSHNFGATYDLDAAQDAVNAQNEAALECNGVRTRRGKSTANSSATAQKKSLSKGAHGVPRKMEKICLETLEVVARFETMMAAAESVGKWPAQLSLHMKHSPEHPFEGYLWRFEKQNPIVEKLCLTTLVVVARFYNIAEAARSVNSYHSKLVSHLQTTPNAPFEGFYWRYWTENPSATGTAGTATAGSSSVPSGGLAQPGASTASVKPEVIVIDSD